MTNTMSRSIILLAFALVLLVLQPACTTHSYPPAVATLTPSHTPIPPTAVASQDITDNQTQALCNNPYFPISKGAGWIYRELNSGLADQKDLSQIDRVYMAVMPDGPYSYRNGDVGADIQVKTGHGTFNNHIRCISGTINLNPAFSFIHVLLPADDLDAGAAWEHVSRIQGETEGDVYTETIRYSTASEQQVDVPAGTFTANCVEYTILREPLPKVDAFLPMDGQACFARGVGRVSEKANYQLFRNGSASSADWLTTEWELTGYDIP